MPGLPPNAALRVPAHPALLFFGVFLAGVAAAHFQPVALMPESLTARLACSLPCFAFALALGLAALAAFRRARGSPQFGAVVSALVRRGPYRFSRNPLYLALLAALLGFAFLFNNAWLAIGVPVLFAALDRFVVRREEQFLSALFGADYASYCKEVRRWL